MDDQRDKLPEPGPASPEPEAESQPSAGAGIPEEAGEIYELVDEDVALPPSPTPPPRPMVPPKPDYPEEALEEIRALKAKLDNKDRQIEQVMEAYRAKKEETEKLRKRIEKTERRKFEQSKGDFIARFVEVLDNLDRAIESIENAFDPDSVLQGIMLVRSRLVQLLKEEGLEKIFVRGQIFDPTHSEAAGMEDVNDDSQDGVVLRELQPGYMLKGALLRVARVVVGRFGGPQEAAAPAVDASEATTAAKVPTIAVVDDEEPAELVLDADDSQPPGALDSNSGGPEGAWDADTGGEELEFGDDGFEFTNE